MKLSRATRQSQGSRTKIVANAKTGEYKVTLSSSKPIKEPFLRNIKKKLEVQLMRIASVEAVTSSSQGAMFDETNTFTPFFRLTSLRNLLPSPNPGRTMRNRADVEVSDSDSPLNIH